MINVKRNLLPGHLWLISHYCLNNERLLRYSRQRQCWLHWLWQAKRQFGLCVLNYMVTPDHVHLLVYDRGEGEILCSMDLVARGVQEDFERRVGRRDPFWEREFLATAIDPGAHLARCLVYLDLHMVRAGAVAHPEHWWASGYRELQCPPERFAIVNTTAVTHFSDATNVEGVRRDRARRVESALTDARRLRRERRWTRSLAVGSSAYCSSVRSGLGSDSRECLRVALDEEAGLGVPAAPGALPEARPPRG